MHQRDSVNIVLKDIRLLSEEFSCTIGEHAESDSYFLLYGVSKSEDVCIDDRVYRLKRCQAILAQPQLFVEFNKHECKSPVIVAHFTSDAKFVDSLLRLSEKLPTEYPVVIIDNAEGIYGLLANLVFEHHVQEPHYDLVCSLLLRVILNELKDNRQKITDDQEISERVSRWIDGNDLSSVSVQQIAQMMGVSVSCLERSFSRRFCMTIKQYINLQKIERAKAELRKTEKSIYEIAFASGFNSKQRFNQVFRQVTGTTPREWRNADKDDPR